MEKAAALIVLLAAIAGCMGGASDPSGLPDPESGPGTATPDGEGDGDDGPPGDGHPEGPPGNEEPAGEEPEDDGEGGQGQNGTGGNGTQTGNSTGNGTHEPHPFDPEEPEGDGNCVGIVPRTMDVGAAATGLATGWPLLELDIVLIADPTFVAAHPGDWKALLADLLADASVHYEEQMGLRLNATLIDRLPDGSLAVDPPPDATNPVGGQDDMRAAARGFMKANHPGADFDAVAVILGADYSGVVAGKVECVGGAADREWAYLWAEYDGPRENPPFLVPPVGLTNDAPLRILMHELGHLLDAHHHYSNCGEAVAYLQARNAFGVCDVMINDIGLASFRFGSLNRYVMRSFVESSGIGEPVG